MSRTLLTISILFLSFGSFAQSLSIDSLWATASSYQKLKQANINLELAKLSIKAQSLGRLPLIYGEANLQRNLIIPSTPVPAIAFDPGAAPDEILPLQFATDWSAKAGIQFSMDLFNPRNKLAIKSAELDTKTAKLDYEKTLKDWKKDATTAYAKVVISSGQYLEAIVDSARYVAIVSVTSDRHKAGRTTLVELNKARQEFINKQTQVSEAYRVLEVANIELSKFVDIRQFNKLSSSMNEILSKLAEESKNLELESIQIEQQKVSLQLKNLKLEALPTLSLNAFYGNQFYNNNFSLWNNNNWFGNSYVNVGLRLPISEAVDRALKKKQLSLQNRVLLSKFQEEQGLAAANNKQEALNIFQAQKALENAKAIERLSAENMELVQDQYGAGKILLTVLNQEISTHFKNKQNVWQAEYDYLTAVLERI